MSFLAYFEWMWVVQSFQGKRKTHWMNRVTIYLPCDAHCTHTKDAKMTKDRLSGDYHTDHNVNEVLWKFVVSLCCRPIYRTESVFGSTSTISTYIPHATAMSSAPFSCTIFLFYAFSTAPHSMPNTWCNFQISFARLYICRYLSLGLVLIIVIVRRSYGNRRLTSLSQLVIRRLCPCGSAYLLVWPQRYVSRLVWRMCGMCAVNTYQLLHCPLDSRCSMWKCVICV